MQWLTIHIPRQRKNQQLKKLISPFKNHIYLAFFCFLFSSFASIYFLIYHSNCYSCCCCCCLGKAVCVNHDDIISLLIYVQIPKIPFGIIEMLIHVYQ